MKKFVLAMLACYSLTIFASDKAIYGVDSRIDVNDSKNLKHKELASSVAALIPRYYTRIDRSQRTLSFIDLAMGDIIKACSGERFAHQPSVSSCTGFLVAPNKLITAGHCIQDQKDCQESQWIFDYKLKTEKDVLVKSLPMDAVYNCKRVIKSVYGTYIKNDWALIELDRKVVGRKPLKLNTKRPSKKDKVFTIGTPIGLPLKVATGFVRSTKIFNYFTTNLDTYVGSSGSPVFNARNEVIGILARGSSDFKTQDWCKRSIVRTEEGGKRGEEVNYIREAALAL